jgi:anti-anti-sigma factor
MQLQIREDSGVLWCDGTLGIQSVEDLRTTLAEHLKQNPILRLDLSAVRECDASGLQLLYAASKQADIAGKRFEISGLSESIQNTSTILGLSLDELMTGDGRV